jgi:hypothetical protein
MRIGMLFQQTSYGSVKSEGILNLPVHIQNMDMRDPSWC